MSTNDISYMWYGIILVVIYLIYIKLFGNKKLKIKEYKKIQVQEYQDKIIHSINNMSGRDFECFVGFIFECLGYKVNVTQASRDGGKDLIIKKDGITTYVELKRYASKNKINSTQVLKLIGSACADGVHNVIFITTSSYSNDCCNIQSNKNMNIQLLDLNDFIDMCMECPQWEVLERLGYEVESRLRLVK